MTNFEVFENFLGKVKSSEVHCVIYKLRTNSVECKPKKRGCTRDGMLKNFEWLFSKYDEKKKLDVDLSELKGCDLPISTWLNEEFKNRCSDCACMSLKGKQWICDSAGKPCKKTYPCPERLDSIGWYAEKIEEEKFSLIDRGCSEEKAEEIAEKCREILSLL